MLKNNRNLLIIALIAAILTGLYLPETNKHMGEVKQGKLFDFPRLWHALFDEQVGRTFLISFVFFFAFSCAIIYGFQPFTVNVLKLTQSQNALLFTMFGIVGLVSQTFIVHRFVKLAGMKKAFTTALLFTSLAFVIMFLSGSLIIFVLASIMLGLFNSCVQTLIPTILSQEADAKSQGSIMGLNASYQSMGMILGPILGGIIATIAFQLPFIAGGFMVLLCFLLSFNILRRGEKKESAF